MTFSDIEQQWQRQPGQPTQSREGRRALWAKLSGKSQGWLKACQAAVRDRDLRIIEPWLEAATTMGGAAGSIAAETIPERCLAFLHGRYAQTAHAYLRCTHMLIRAMRTDETPPIPDRELEALSTQIPALGWPIQQWRDVVDHLHSGGSSTPVLHSVCLPVVLTAFSPQQEPTGIVADLKLDLRPQGRGILYPTVLMAFVQRDNDFQSAEAMVCAYLRAAHVWPTNYDVCWQLTRRTDASPILDLEGGSLGAALALGLAKLFALEGFPLWAELSALQLRHLTLTACCTVDGKLEPVTYLDRKIEAARSAPPLHWLIVSDNQPDLHRYLTSSDERPLPMVGAAATLQAAVQWLVNIQNPRDPFRRLVPFSVNDAAYFGGRAEEIQSILSRLGESRETGAQELTPKQLRQKRLTALVGRSGSGKSSLAFAGVVPQLDPQRWISAACRPQLDLSGNLVYAPQILSAPRSEQAGEAKSLVEHVVTLLEDAPGKQLLLIIDQFEELFNAPTPGQQRVFMEHLGRLVQAEALCCAVLATIRTDFLHRLETPIGWLLAEFSWEDFVVMLIPMTTTKLIQAMHTPVVAVGLRFEAGLETRIAEELQDTPGVLIALEIVLAALFEQRDGALLTHTAYEAMAKGREAIAQYADNVIEQLVAAEAPRLREDIETQLQEIFGTLVWNDDGTASKSTRYVASLAEIGVSNLPMVDTLVNKGLLVRVPEGIQVAHEALIDYWPLMQQWVEKHGVSRQFRQKFLQWYSNQLAWPMFMVPVYAGIIGLLTRPLFAYGFGTFLLQPIHSWALYDLSPAMIHGFFGTWLGSLLCLNLAMKVFIAIPHTLSRRTSALLILPGFTVGAFLCLLMWRTEPVAAWGYLITGTFGGLGAALGMCLGDHWGTSTDLARSLRQRCVGAGLGALGLLLTSLCVIGPVFSAFFPQAMAPRHLMTRAWGEVFEQSVSVWAFLGCFYLYLRQVQKQIGGLEQQAPPRPGVGVLRSWYQRRVLPLVKRIVAVDLLTRHRRPTSLSPPSTAAGRRDGTRRADTLVPPSYP